MRNKFTKVLGFFLILIAIIFQSGCKNKSQYQHIRFHISTEPLTLDPQVANDFPSNVLTMNLFEGLVRIGVNNEIVSGVAEDWVSYNEDKTFIFHLRKDVKWSDDKTIVTAKDFFYGITRAINPNTVSKTAKSLYIIKNARKINLNKTPMDELGIFVVDDYTLKFDLEYSFKDFPRVCALPAAMPCSKDFFESTAGQYGKDSKKLLTNGPFRISNSGWKRGSSINIVRNENYVWKDDRVFTPMVTFFVKDDPKISEVDLFKNDEVDVCNLTKTEYSKIFEENKNLNTVSFNDSYWGIIFNCSSDIFKNENMRRAFLSAIDREYIISKLPKENLPEFDSIIGDEMILGGKKYRDLVSNKVCFKPTTDARSILTAALKELKISKLSDVTLLCPNEEDTKSVANNLLEVFNKNLGQHLNIKPMPRDDLNKEIVAGSFMIAFAPISVKSDNPMGFLNSFRSDYPQNPAKLNSAEYDKLMVNAENSSFKEMASSVFEAEKYISDRAVFYPICREDSYFITNKRIENVIFYPYQVGVDFTFAKKRK
ncbi:MAG: peptide ABC transporter substrate-binding protein [Oscillospiraceae bacterium]|nr:peptide ABC transporter substrate-binding protein [Oscillospiraceae bacterium]